MSLESKMIKFRNPQYFLLERHLNNGKFGEMSGGWVILSKGGTVPGTRDQREP